MEQHFYSHELGGTGTAVLNSTEVISLFIGNLQLASIHT